MTRVRVAPSWLAVREAADAAARATDLVEEFRPYLPVGRPLVIHDLACGTGATMRWLAPQLPGPQRWVNHDLDEALLEVLATGPTPAAAGGSPVTVQTRHNDVTRLEPSALAGAALITSSALLDLLCADELRSVVRACAQVQCPVLFTLTVTGEVRLEPRHSMDDVIAAAFNAHQRRAVSGRRLLGPDAADAAERMFADLGCAVTTRSSAWQLDSTSRALTYEWLVGWLAAACEQDHRLGAALDDYARRRLAAAVEGRLRVVVEHRDLLVRRPAVHG